MEYGFCLKFLHFFFFNCSVVFFHIIMNLLFCWWSLLVFFVYFMYNSVNGCTENLSILCSEYGINACVKRSGLYFVTMM